MKTEYNKDPTLPETVNDNTRPSALVTGAGSGIGKAIARHLNDAGFRIFICDADPKALEAFRAEMPEASALVCDVADEAAVAAVMADILAQTGGRLDVLVNNAGISGMNAAVENTDPEDFRRTMDVNVNGAFYFLTKAVPVMKSRGRGSIINIASTAALLAIRTVHPMLPRNGRLSD
nr:SDR family oxidoreductase [Marinicella sp. W31]MDC2877243.1 SDR family NAD(P)-dependent oxidoreductase [Marinicella sp. W31]